jgi:osmotically-inducible protein OsmY
MAQPARSPPVPPEFDTAIVKETSMDRYQQGRRSRRDHDRDYDRGYGQQEQYSDRSRQYDDDIVDRFDDDPRASNRAYPGESRGNSRDGSRRDERGYSAIDDYDGNNDYGGGRRQGSRQGGGWRERERGSRGGYGYDQDRYDRDYDNERYGGYDDGRTTGYGAGYGAGYGSGYAGGYRGRRRDGERGFFDKAGDEVASWFGDDDAERRRMQDHRGRGPSDYKRSDDRIREDANDRLTDDWGIDASDIKVKVNKQEITLDGTVDSRRSKRRAEDLVHDVSGVRHVQNNLRISEPNSDKAMNDTSRTGSIS